MTINDGNPSTSTRRVKLSLRADDPSLRSDVVEMRIKNGGGDPWTEWRTYATQVDWKLSEGEGEKAVYAQFKDRAGNRSEPVKATITLRSRVSGGSKSEEGDKRTTRRADETLYPEPRVSDSEVPSRLASEGVARLDREDPEIFFDSYDQDAHEKFLRWRERNRGGYVVSRRSASDAMLHRTYCGHFEHGDKSASLTRTMKVCAESKGELEAWARGNVGGRLKRCRSCM